MWRLLCVLALLTLAFVVAVRAFGEETKNLQSGDAALDFRLNDHNGDIVHLASFQAKETQAKEASDEGNKRPKRVLLAFYPKDFTGG